MSIDESPKGAEREEGSHMRPVAPGLVHTTHEYTLDTDAMLSETRMRMRDSLEVGYDYHNALIDSNTFLHNNARRKFKSAVMYVDLVGSTKLAQTLPSNKQSIVVGSFVQEMAHVIMEMQGLALKYVGDAVIGYFVASGNPRVAAGRAVQCSQTMLDVIRRGMNPVLAQYRYPELHAKIGIDYGENTVIIYGNRSRISQADMIGRSMNMASKIQNAARPDQILIGRDVYIRLDASAQREFSPVNADMPYCLTRTGEPYIVYAHRFP